jgi:hypothetical protein
MHSQLYAIDRIKCSLNGAPIICTPTGILSLVYPGVIKLVLRGLVVRAFSWYGSDNGKKTVVEFYCKYKKLYVKA